MKHPDSRDLLASAKRNQYLIACAIGLSWLALYWKSFGILLGRWDTEDYSYCYLVPFLALYLAYQQKDQLRKNMGGGAWPGYIGLALTAVLFLAGVLGALETLVYASIWFSIVSLAALLLGGRALRPLGFPLMIAAFIVPAPPFISNQLTFNLRLISSTISVKILQAFGVSAYREGNVIDLGFTKLQVVDACSGLRYVIPAVLLALVIGFLFNKKLWERVALAILSAPIAVMVNALRIVAMGLLARYVSAKFAEEGFLHDFSGWVIFILMTGLLTGFSFVFRYASKRLGKANADSESENGLDAKEEGEGDAASQQPVLAGLNWRRGLIACATFLAILVAQLLLGSTQATPARANFSDFPLFIGNWEGQRSYLDEEVLKSLWADDYVLVLYTNRTTGNRLQLLIPYYEHQTTQHTAHAPASCLMGGGWSIKEKHRLPPDPLSGRTFSVEQMVLEKNGQYVLSNFWFQQRGRVLVNEYENKFYLFWDALTRRRTDGALIRLELSMTPHQSVQDAQHLLDGFSASLKEILKGHVPD